jgi:hypothetical protein
VNLVRVLLAVALLATSASAQRIAFADVDVRGPCTGITVQLELAGSGPTRLALDVPVGSTSRIELPLLLPPDLQPSDLASLRAPRLDPNGGSATFAGWQRPATLERWAAVPSGLRARPRSAPPELRAAPSLAACALLLAAGCAALATRRAAARIALGLVALAAGWGIAPRGSDPQAVTAVWEFDADSERGLAWQSSSGALAFDADALVTALAAPPVPAAGMDLRRADSTWRWRAEGARLWTASEIDAASLAHGELVQAWTRRAGGAWVALGAPGSPEPPGWLVAGLPMGVDLVLGVRSGANEERTWVRWVGPFDGRLALPR